MSDPQDLLDDEIHRLGGPVGGAGAVVGEDLDAPEQGGAGQTMEGTRELLHSAMKVSNRRVASARSGAA